jgi:hypothetical protein
VYDSNQWVLQRRLRATRSSECAGITDSDWRGVSYVGGKKATLARLFREKGIVLTPEAQNQLDALPERFMDFLVEPCDLSPLVAARRAA